MILGLLRVGRIVQVGYTACYELDDGTAAAV